MMRKYIMVKIGRSKKRKLSKKTKFNEHMGLKFINFAEMGEFINFVEIGGICNMHHWLWGRWTTGFGITLQQQIYYFPLKHFIIRIFYCGRAEIFIFVQHQSKDVWMERARGVSPLDYWQILLNVGLLI